ncbi:MAG: InlB B-repeat-containing protein [Tannerella sp.]|jgi:uncharacterized repeat protein (TIGR02543 family)|nr:InlB B-repeat-containing protein [Tannerella sp.]
MKKTKTIFLTACLSLFITGGYAQAPVTLYSGESLPTEQSWNEWKLDNTVNSVAAPVTQTLTNDALRFSSVNEANQFSQLGWYKTGLGLDLSKGYTVEIKAKLNVATKGSFNIQGFDNEGKGFRIGISETAITNQSNPLDSTTVIASNLTGDTEFHVYRLTATPWGQMNVYRDAVLIGTFPLKAFQFDNIIENGGFEDEEFPDFQSNAILERISERPFAGQSALLINSDGKNNGTNPKEGMTTREFPLKPDTDYEFSMTRRRAILNDEWAWRDFGAYWNTQSGSVREQNVTNSAPCEKWWNNGFENPGWITGTETLNKGSDVDKNTIRFEFPSWIRNTNNTSKVAIDNIVLREKTGLKVGVTTTPESGIPDPVFPEEYTNLIANGGFEDHTINNDGTTYTWTLSNEDNNNEPVGSNSLWNGSVRIQRNDKPDDELTEGNGATKWAHSGTSSLRFSTLGNNANNFDFVKELDAGKTYRFNFWHKNPRWDDWGWLKVKIGDTVIWGQESKARNNVWANVDLIFTTTSENKTLHLYTTSADHGDWFNVFLDDLVLYEITGAVDPQIAGKTNLIANGDFEDTSIDNAGQTYTWALASDVESNDSNYPVAWNEQWGSYVRIQDKQKQTDTGLQWAHSGNNSLRFSFLDDMGHAQTFEGLSSDVYPNTYRINMDFKKELEPNKTYTFVFWIRSANYGDKGKVAIANDDIRIWEQEMSTQFVNWTRKSVTFSTTAANHTLRFITEFTGWFNFYLDDLFLYEEDTYVPYEANGDSYLFFGKSQNTASADIEVEYVKIIDDGAYAPGEEYDIVVTYNLNGGEGDTESNYNTANEAVTLPVPTRTGYTFLGWYDNSAFTGEAVTEIPKETTDDKEFWAKWEAIAYTVTYNLNGGTGDETGTYTIESNTLTLPVPARTGYTFRGWYDNSAFTGEAVTEIPAGSTGNKEFWAKWEAIAYAITYNLNGGTGDETGTYTIETAVTLPVPAKDDYDFAGWYENEELSGTPVTEIPVGSTGNKEFWAKWDIKNAINTVDTALRLYPNPVVNGKLTIGNSLSDGGKIEIYNLLGTLAGVYNTAGSKSVIDISALPAGTYVVKTSGQIAKIVKK